MNANVGQVTNALKKVMILGGLWRLNVSNQNNKLIEIVYSVYAVIIQLSYFAFLMGFVIELPHALKKNDFESVIEIIAYIFIIATVHVKGIIFQSKRVRNLIIRCNIEEQETFVNTSEDIKENFAKNLKAFKTTSYVVATYLLSTAFLAVVAAYDLFVTKNEFLFRIWYPISRETHPSKAFYLQWLYAFVSSFINLASQILFITLMSHAAMQIKALQIKCRDFHLYIEPPIDESDNEEKRVLAALRKLFIKHQHIIDFIEELNVMKNALLIEFLLYSINIAGLLVQITTMVNPLLMQLYLGALLGLMVMELFVMTWHANEIQTQSLLLSDSLYQSQWYEYSTKAKKLFMLMMMRCKKPLMLYIGPFYPMQNSTAVSTIKAAYSYAALFLTIANKS